MVHDASLPVLGKSARTEIKDIVSALENNSNSPIRVHAAETPDSKVYFEAKQIQLSDLAGLSIPPNNGTIPYFPESTIDFQTQATTGGTFDVIWPTSTVGMYRRVGFTLLISGAIKMLFTPEAATLSALANPGTIFVKGALPIGWIDLECTDAAGLFKTAGSASNIIENSVGGVSRIVRFGSGGGSGSGTGDANELLERLKDRLDDSPFSWLNDNIFSIQEDTKVDPSTTALYDVVETAYKFEVVGQFVESEQILDAEFIATGKEILQIELMAFWKLTALDTAATYQVSLDGGSTYETVTMTRVGLTDTYRGVHIFATPVAVPQDLRVKITAGTANTILKGYGIFYDLQFGVATDHVAIEKQLVVGGTNPNTFTLSKFLPDPDLLRVYAVETGQVFRYGAFSLSGYTVTFPVDTFNISTNLTLIFDQTVGSTFDSSDKNASLMAANFLGSTDTNIDRSQPGRGIVLRSPDGSLYEITVKDGGTGFDIYLVT
jgi:hypothetical protein